VIHCPDRSRTRDVSGSPDPTVGGKKDLTPPPLYSATREVCWTTFGVGREGPRQENERIIAEVWAEALGVERVGIPHNIFNLCRTARFA